MVDIPGRDAGSRAGERVVASVSRFLTQKLRLTVNEAKSAVARPEERKFLGFSISNDGSERRIAPKVFDKFKAQIRDMTRRTRGVSLAQVLEDLTPCPVVLRKRAFEMSAPAHPSHGLQRPDALTFDRDCPWVLQLR
jgi:hypothetical protein